MTLLLSLSIAIITQMIKFRYNTENMFAIMCEFLGYSLMEWEHQCEREHQVPQPAMAALIVKLAISTTVTSLKNMPFELYDVKNTLRIIL